MNPPGYWYNLSQADIENLIDDILAGEQEVLSDKNIMKDIFSCIDLTTLEGSDNNEKISQLCNKAKSFIDKGLPIPAAVCIYPAFVRSAKILLSGTGISVAAVTGYFPSGQAPLFLKMEEVKYSVDEGADEIDFVMSRGKFLEGNEQYIFDEVSSVKEYIKTIHLKVILETGEIQTGNNIRKASEIAISAGADFIKTSTGKYMPAATEFAAFIMLNVINEHFLKTGVRIGFKPAGGIVSPHQAIRYYILVRHLLGSEWLKKDLFRIGASRLADNLSKELTG
jgi:deoxyribose-phosphate aldolase